MMPTRSLARTATGALLALLVAAPALLAADAPVTLQRNAKRGDIARYQSEVAGKVGDANVEFTVTNVSKGEVTDVKENGDVLTLMTEESTKLVAAGMEQESKLSPPFTVTRDKQGRVKGVEGEIGDGQVFTREMALTLLEMDEPVLSEKAVVVGQTWETERDNPLMNGKKFLLKTTLEAVEKDGDKTLWKVKQTADVETTTDPLKNETTFWLDSANGQIVRLEAAVSGIPSPFGVMSWNEKRSLQK